MDFKDKTVGAIVADNFYAARVFKRYDIDFCCHGQIPLGEACVRAGVSLSEVSEALLQPERTDGNGSIPFGSWPLDLLLDYVLKVHHRNIRKNGPRLLELIGKVRSAHAGNHPELAELYLSVEASLSDLEQHLQKEEQVLFPYLYALFEASEQGRNLEPMHCGTVANPIRVMRQEHEHEGERYQHIIRLTDHFKLPADGCATYRLMLEELETFVDGLFEHIHIENNLIFPRFQHLEARFVPAAF